MTTLALLLLLENKEMGIVSLYVSRCSGVAVKVAELDSLVSKVIELEIPPDFADRVVAKISGEESQHRLKGNPSKPVVFGHTGSDGTGT